MDCSAVCFCSMALLLAVTVADATQSDVNVTVVVVNSTVTLSCRGFTESTVRWEHYAVGSNQPVDVYNGNKISPNYTHTHSVAFDSRSPGVSNLTVNSVQMNDAGRYRCFQSPITASTKEIELVVLESEPLCSCPKCFDNVINAMEHETLHVSCVVVHSHYDKLFAPFKCEVSPAPGFSHDIRTHTNKSLTGSVCRHDCIIDIPANRNLQDRRLTCRFQFSNSSRHAIVAKTIETRTSWNNEATFNVLYGPNSMHVNVSNGTLLHSDSVLSCTADSNPPSTYTWTDITTGRTLHNGSMFPADKLFADNKLTDALIKCTATAANRSTSIVVAVQIRNEATEPTTRQEGDDRSRPSVTALLICCVLTLFVFVAAVVCVVWRLRTNGGCHVAKHPDVVPSHAPAQPTESLELGVLHASHGTPPSDADPSGQTQLTASVEGLQTTLTDLPTSGVTERHEPSQTLIRQHPYMVCLPPEEGAPVDPTTGSLLYADLAISPRQDIVRKATSTPNMTNRVNPIYAAIDHRIKTPRRNHRRGVAGKVSSHHIRQTELLSDSGVA